MSHFGTWIPMPETKFCITFTHETSGTSLSHEVGNSVKPWWLKEWRSWACSSNLLILVWEILKSLLSLLFPRTYLTVFNFVTYKQTCPSLQQRGAQGLSSLLSGPASHLFSYFILYVLLTAQLILWELFFPQSLMAATGGGTPLSHNSIKHFSRTFCKHAAVVFHKGQPSWPSLPPILPHISLTSATLSGLVTFPLTVTKYCDRGSLKQEMFILDGDLSPS